VTSGAVEAPAAAPAPPAEPPRAARPYVLAAVLALVVAPVLVAIVAVSVHAWYPASDNALEVLRIRDVGGAHTPLTGVQSRYGWDHPGPLLFWTLAPFDRVAGNNGILVGVAIVNAAALAGVVYLAHRRGGAPLVVLAGVAVVLMCRTAGADLLVEPWNPWIAVLPFACFLMLAWSVAERDFAALPWLVGVGTFLVQTHVGYLPLVAGSAVGALVLARWSHPEEARREHRPGPAAKIAAVVGAVRWIAPVMQQLFGEPANLGKIVSYFLDPQGVGEGIAKEDALGLEKGFGLFGRELPFTWLTGDDGSVFGFAIPGRTLPAVLFVLATVGAGLLAGRRGARAQARLALLLAGVVLVGVYATSRITGQAFPYLLRWWWVIGALCAVSLAWSLLALAGTERAARVLVPAGALAAVVAVAVFLPDAADAEAPQAELSKAVGELAGPTAARLRDDRTYLLTWRDAHSFGGPTGVGLYAELARRGFDVKVVAELSHPFGHRRAAGPGETNGSIVVVSSDDIGGYVPEPGAAAVASYDPLAPDERRRVAVLEAQIRAAVEPRLAFRPTDVETGFGRLRLAGAGAEPGAVEEMARLRDRGAGYTVFVNPPS
jgi:hypothetical protein